MFPTLKKVSEEKKPVLVGTVCSFKNVCASAFACTCVREWWNEIQICRWQMFSVLFLPELSSVVVYISVIYTLQAACKHAGCCANLCMREKTWTAFFCRWFSHEKQPLASFWGADGRDKRARETERGWEVDRSWLLVLWCSSAAVQGVQGGHMCINVL